MRLNTDQVLPELRREVGVGMTKSIMQDERACYVTGSTTGLHLHHCIHGSNRGNADRYGLTVYLRNDVHRALHERKPPFATLDDSLKREAQMAFEKANPNGAFDPRADFMRIFGVNYLY